jgi:putative protein kinase ArgK-like GTPase of G3E family
VIETVATEGQGIARLAQAIAAAFEEGERTGALHERREARLAREVIDLAKSMLAHRLDALARSEAFGELCQRVLAGAETPGSAALHAVSMAVRESADRP